jgi:hypothetical protein
MAFNKIEILDGISKTGFILENEIQNHLKNDGWTIISNRYYIDDVQGTEREMDIVAYKARTDSEDVVYYTALIISCKKDNENHWVFLTTNSNMSDLNTDFYPFHYIANEERLKLMLSSYRQSVIDKIKTNTEIVSIFDYSRNISAFQQLKKGNSTAQNDKHIYNSISTLIKAVESEKKQINGDLKKKNRIYSFYLLSVVKGEMLEVNLDNYPRDVVEIEDINYLNRHIVNRTDNFYRIRFVRDDYFKSVLHQYDELHNFNFQTYSKMLQEFYDDIFEHNDRVKLYWEQFISSIRFEVNWQLRKVELLKDIKVTGFNYDYSKKNGLTLEPICEEYSQWQLLTETLNDSYKTNHKFIANKLNEFFRYKGSFNFDNILPF